MIEQLREEIAQQLRHHYKGQRWWSVAHHSTTFGAAILSLFVAAIAQLKDWQPQLVSRDVLMAALSLVAAILAVLSARGGFERKWIANRLTRSKLDLLRIEMLGDVQQPEVVKETLKRIVADHDAAIVGSTRSPE